jgi:hypothetical protein
MLTQEWIGPVIIAAAIAASINVLGWFVTGQREIRRDRRRRRERREDVQVALRAEIQHYVDILSNPGFDLNKTWAEVVGQMETDENYAPFVPSERNDTVFITLLTDVSILPEPVIGPVVRYYNQVFAIEAMIDDLRSRKFDGMEQEQRIKMYTDYISLKIEALEQGNIAIAALSQSLPAPGARASTPGVVRSGQS